jgi:hypothetical protein
MAITLSNGVNNVNATPGINSNTFANRPAATDVAVGSIYIATDTGTIYQSNGTTWQTLGGGGGPTPTPGIDDVLAVGQLFTTGRTINANTNFLHIDGITNFRVQSGGINVFNHSTGTGTRVQDGSSLLNVQTAGILTTAPTGGGSVSTQGFNFTWATRSYNFGNYGLGGNQTKIDILDTSQQIYFSNKGVTNGVYCDFSNKLYLYGRLNSGSEHNFEIDEVNQFTRAKFAGIVNGFSLDYSATVYQFGSFDTTLSQDTYININGNNGTIQSFFNGNDNGLNIGFLPGSRKYLFGDYQGNFNSTSIQLDDDATTILIKGNQSAGSTTFEANSLIFTGANLESTTPPTLPALNWLNVTVNGIAYKIALES